MTALTLHYHPLSSYCQKVLIAIDLLAVEVDKRLLDLGNPAERDAYLALWPTGKMPLLLDQGRPVPESSIIIEHLQQNHAGGGRTLIPHAAAEALDVRLWDRLFDLYVMTPMQALTADLLKPEGDRDPRSVARAREVLSMAYAMIERQLEGRTWVAGDAFSMADCAAAPALFYASTLVPFADEHRHLSAYFDRLTQRPSVARVIDEARPWFSWYPFAEAIPERFR